MTYTVQCTDCKSTTSRGSDGQNHCVVARKWNVSVLNLTFALYKLFSKTCACNSKQNIPVLKWPNKLSWSFLFHSVEVFYVKTYSKMGINELLVKYTTSVIVFILKFTRTLFLKNSWRNVVWPQICRHDSSRGLLPRRAWQYLWISQGLIASCVISLHFTHGCVK